MISADGFYECGGELIELWKRSFAERPSPAPVSRPVHGGDRVGDRAEFARAMEDLRYRSGLTFRQVAEASGPASSTVHALCKGTRRDAPPVAQVRSFLSAPGLSEWETGQWIEALARIRRTTLPTGRESHFTTAAAHWWRKAADAGDADADAMNYLGDLHRKNRELDSAEMWWRRAADHSHPEAMNSLAILFNNDGRTALAREFYDRAARVGHVAAMHGLGLLYEGEENYHMAMTWYRLAAESGDPDAAERFGVLFGKVRPKDAAWFQPPPDVGEA